MLMASLITVPTVEVRANEISATASMTASEKTWQENLRIGGAPRLSLDGRLPKLMPSSSPPESGHSIFAAWKQSSATKSCVSPFPTYQFVAQVIVYKGRIKNIAFF